MRIRIVNMPSRISPLPNNCDDGNYTPWFECYLGAIKALRSCLPGLAEAKAYVDGVVHLPDGQPLAVDVTAQVVADLEDLGVIYEEVK